MQPYSLPFKPANILAVLLLLLASNIYAMPADSAYKHPYPRMFAGESDTPMIRYKQARKHIMETDYKDQPDQFMIKGWMNMINYFKVAHPLYTCLRVYICAYTEDNKALARKKNKLALVFVPCRLLSTNSVKELGYYCIPDNDSFNVLHVSHFKIDSQQVQNWHTHYQQHFLKHLSKDIDNTNTENQNRDGYYTDTWCLSYCRSAIQELVKERQYIHTTSDNKTRINISRNMLFSLATFSDVTAHGVKKSGRLFLAIDFVDKNNKVVAFKTMYNAGKRRYVKYECTECSADKKGFVDNGQLCPPASNCP